jgi:serine carboxypeptidase-like clade I
MNFACLAFVCFSLLTLSTNAAVSSDEVKSLPGWDSALPSRIWSGHVSAGSDIQNGKNYSFLHWYMFVESELPNAADAPVLLFSNGGPGASSAFGLFTEFGPLQLSIESLDSDPPKLFYNPYAWTQLANILIINGPPPVGFSYCNPAGPTGDGYSCGSWNDTRTAVQNVEFINNWYSLFPEYKKNPLYIVGESYAGVYTGQIVSMLLEQGSTLNIKGLGLGDACMGTDVLCGSGGPKGPYHDLLFSFGQGCISYDTFDSIITQCPLQTLKFGPMSSAPASCKTAVAKASSDCPSGSFFAYNYLDQCPPSAFSKEKKVNVLGDPAPPIEPGGYPCGGDQALSNYMSRDDVKIALNVDPSSTFNSFDNGEGFVYNLTWQSNFPLLRRLQTGQDGITVLAYNGETDPSISSIKTQNWTVSLNFPLIEAWRPWTYPAEINGGIVAGMVRQWQGLTHATVRGSGHMLPTYKPYSAFLMIKNWMSGDNWPALTSVDDQEEEKQPIYRV